MPTDKDEELMNAVFSMVSPLHDRRTALLVTKDILDRIQVSASNVRLQDFVYLVSDEWERDQESGVPKKPENTYRPTFEDLLVRYIKFIVWKTMRHDCHHLGAGIGCLLWTYQPKEIVEILNLLSNKQNYNDNIRRDKSRLLDKLAGSKDKKVKARFSLQRIFYGSDKENDDIERKPGAPTERECRLVYNSLLAFRPRITPLFRDVQGAMAQLSGNAERALELERVYALLDPGLVKLIHEHNRRLLAWDSLLSGVRASPEKDLLRIIYTTKGIDMEHPKGTNIHLDDPDDKLRIPKFGAGSFSGPADALGPDDRFNPVPLTEEEREFVKDSLHRNRRRRKLHRASLLRVYVDGEELLEFDPHTNASQTFNVPSDASYVEVFGHGDEEDLCLGVFPLSNPESAEDERAQHLSVTLGSGQKVEIEVSFSADGNGEVPESHVRITYSESSFTPALVFCWRTAAAITTALSKLLGFLREPPRLRGLLWRYAPAAVIGALLVGGFTGYGLRGVIDQRVEKSVGSMVSAQGARFAALPVSARNEMESRLQELATRLPQAMQGAKFKTLVTWATAFMYGEDFVEAIEIFERAKEIDPDGGEPYKAIAAMRKIQGAHEESVRQLKAFLQRRPEDREAWNFLGWSYFSLGEYEEARKAYKNALTRPDNLDALADYPDALLNLALLEQQQGNTARYQELMERARQLLHREVSDYPHHAIAYFHLAKLYAHKKDWDQALSYLEKAIANDPEWAFWVRYEVFFQEIVKADPDVKRPIGEVADIIAANKVRQTLASL